MLTATGVCPNDFDRTFPLEREQMTVRERGRKDDRKKRWEREREREREKEKGAQAHKAADLNNPYTPGTRRIVRNNGQELEVAITGPLQLER